MDVEAPEGVDSVLAMSAEDQGLSIWNTSSKGHPTVAYQQYGGPLATRVAVATVGGVHYAFSLAGDGVYVYNMSAATQYDRCGEEFHGSVQCPGVYRGHLPGTTSGTGIDAVGTFLAVARARAGFEIWNVENPASPVKVMSSATSARDIALWRSGNSLYAATVAETGIPDSEMRIYDVSCIQSGFCSPTLKGGPVAVPGGGTEPSRYITFSMGGGKPFLYVGGEEQAACVDQREYLFDVSNPAAPVDISPPGYWKWYYERCLDGGFNWVAPYRGKFNGDYFYRAAYSLLDVHKLAVAGPPTADFSWTPAEIYPGTPATFSDLSAGGPTAWTWSFQDAIPPVSLVQNPTGVVFASEGVKQVQLTVSNANAIAGVSVSKNVTVLSPRPVIAGVSANLPSAKVCQPVTLTASATGRPALSYAWTILDAQGNPLVAPNTTGSGNPFVWNTQGVPAGSYEARVVVTTPVAADGSGTLDTYQASPGTPLITLAALEALPVAGSFTPTNDAFTSGTVQFHINAPGATSWRWDFGDGTPIVEVTDPIQGPNPAHTYASTGSRQVKVQVRNCLLPAGQWIDSAALTVSITQITPLTALFSVNIFGCSSGVCFVDQGRPIAFLDQSEGAAFWDYDWDGNGTWEDAGNTTARTSHAYAGTGTFTPKLRVRRGAEESVYTLPFSLVVGLNNTPPSITISGPSSGQPNTELSFTATASNCTPAATWSWSAPGGLITGDGATVSITWASAGSKSISVTNSGCAGAPGTRSVTIGGTTGTLKASFLYSPTAPKAGQAIAFDGSSSTGGPTGYVWDFGDGTALGSGVQAQHPYAKAGSYKVSLSVTGPGNCPPAPFCENTSSQTVVVTDGQPPLVASFTTSATCVTELGFEQCNARTGDAVQLTDTSTGNITTRSWSFGDGQTGSGTAVSHTFATPGTYTVTLTIGDGTTTSSASRNFKVEGAVTPQKKSVVLPWIAQTRGALEQSSDLYVYNPASAPIQVSMTFLKRGTPEANPPKVTRTIQPGATQFTADVLRELFDRENIAGFVMVTVEDGTVEPIITSFNTTFQDDGTQFGQTISGISATDLSKSAALPVQNLVGLNNNSDRLAYFGISNPGEDTGTYRLRFYNRLGQKVAESGDLTVARFGQRQYQSQDIHDQFGISDLDDYRVEVETKSGSRLFPYAANLRLASDDPSFVQPGISSSSKAYLVGVFSTPGLGGSRWQSDVVVSNTSDQVVITDMRFLSVGVQSAPTSPVTLTLQPGETQRIENVLSAKWGLTNTVGVLLFDSNSPSGVYPVVQGEVYDNARPEKRFGQSMTGQVTADVADGGQSQVLVGLRQDATYRTTVTLYNPGTANATFDVIYRALDGTVLGTLADQTLAPGKARQINPSQHKLPAAGVTGGFTVELKVKAGSLLATGQVVNNRTNDPAFISGRAR
jgi:PKD repeat protein